MHLSFGDCAIREFRRSDADAIVAHGNNRNVSKNLTDRFPHPYTAEDAIGWIEIAQAQQPKANFCIVNSTDALIGGIGLVFRDDVYRRSAELGYWLGESFWGKGTMTRAVSRFTEWAFGAFDLVRIYAGVFETNPGSARVLEKAGYEREGVHRKAVFKDDRLLDVHMYARVR